MEGGEAVREEPPTVVAKRRAIRTLTLTLTQTLTLTLSLTLSLQP